VHDHPHDHHHQHSHADHGQPRLRHAADPGPGHNRPKTTTQWQVLHQSDDIDPTPPAERDLDLVETSFVEGFGRSSDPTSFLRLAGIPFVGIDSAGRRFHLLRVEIEALTDIGAVSPLLGGEEVRYDPLPARMVSRRRCLAFVYHDGEGLARLHFAEARVLKDDSAPSQFSVTMEARSP
jgi:hypothetical protein